MKNFSKEWYDALAIERFTGDWPSVLGPSFPMLPFVTCPIPPVLRRIFREHGEVHYFQPNDSIIDGTIVKGMQIVESGLSCRIAATLEGQDGPGLMGLAAPHRFATGNLNFASRRPQIGQYLAISKVVTRRLSHAKAEDLGLLSDPDLMRMLLALKENIHLSDRLALTIAAILPAPLKFAAFLIGWGCYFGTLESGPRGQRIRIPTPGRARHVANVVNVSDVTMDKMLLEYRHKAGFERDGDFLMFDTAILQDAHDWMRGTDAEHSLYQRPLRVQELFERAVQQGSNPKDGLTG